MTPTVSGLQRRVGLGGSLTLLGLLSLGYPIYLSLEPGGGLIGFALHDTTIVLSALLVVFAASAMTAHRVARIAQAIVLILFGFVTLASAAPGALTGLAIASVGVMLAAHYGYLRHNAHVKGFAIVAGALASLAVQAVIGSLDAGPSWTALQFSYNAVGVLGLAASYFIVLQDAAATASRRQAALQEAVDERTRALSREVESRRQAEASAKEAADRAEHLARERLELLSEVQHRANNSLQMTLTLLETTELDSTEDRVATINRIRAIGLVYDLIDNAVDLSSIVLQDYMERLVGHLQMSREYGPVTILLSTSGEHHTSIEPTINFGLMIHEIVSLICRHAFEFRPDAIDMRQHHQQGYLRVVLSHEGKGLPYSGESLPTSTRDLGLLPALVDRLHCEARIERGETTVWHLSIPEDVMTKREPPECAQSVLTPVAQPLP
ncbi:MAG: histidine kinase dimerization/phosphoacceptor domain -containing protein [Spirochaetota bacterium]